MSGTSQLYSMNQDGTNIIQLTNDVNFPVDDARYSPDGRRIVVSSPVGGLEYYGDALYLMNSDGTGRFPLTKADSTNSSRQTGISPVWSPDSKRLSFSRIVGPEGLGNYDIFMINADGSNEQQLTHSQDTSEFVTDWSRDGRYLLGEVEYETIDSSGQSFGHTRVTVFTLEGNYVRSWPENSGIASFHPIYSSSGDRVAFISSKLRYQAIYISSPDGAKDTLLTNRDHFFNQPVSWSPDDNYILYDAGSDGPVGSILMIEIKTGKVLDITPFHQNNVFSYAVSWRKK